jgi:polysaccharide biosynthesis protein PslE
MLNDKPYETHTVSWDDVRAAIAKYGRLVLVVTLSGILGTYIALQVLFTTQYESKATLLVKVGRENTELPAAVLNGQILNQGVRIADINSEVQMLSSRVLAERIVDEVGADKFKFEPKKPESIFGYPKYWVKKLGRWGKSVYKEFLILANIKKRLSPREEAILGVADAVTAEPVKESDVLVLKVRLPDAALAQDVANRILVKYLEERARVRSLSAGAQLFDAQVEENRRRLRKLLDQRSELREQWNLSAADQQRGLLLQELSSIRQQTVQNEAEITQLQQQQAMMKSQLSSLPEMVRTEQIEARNPALQSIKDRLTSLQVERAKLASRYQPDSQTMKRIDEEIRDLQANLDKETLTVASSTTSAINPVVRDFKASIEQNQVRIAGLTSRNQDLNTSAARIQSELDKVNRGSDAYESVEREYRIAEQTYLETSKKREDSHISAELDSGRLPNVAIMTWPEMPIEPVYPRQLFTLAFAIPVSLLLGIAVAALFETMDDRINDGRSVEGMGGVEFLGSWKVAAAGAPGEANGSD